MNISLLSRSLALGLLLWGLSSLQPLRAQTHYPYRKHLARVSPLKVGYEYLTVRSDTSAAYWAIGVQTGILPDLYLGPLEPWLMFFPGVWLERGYRHYLPHGAFWEWVPYVRAVYMEWQEPHESLDLPAAYWEGIGGSVGLKFMYSDHGAPVSAFNRTWSWHWYLGLGVQANVRYQRDYLTWEGNRYESRAAWDTSVLPGLTGHAGIRLGTGR